MSLAASNFCMVIPTQQLPRSTQRIYLYGYTYAALTQKHTKDLFVWLYLRSRYPEAHKGIYLYGYTYAAGTQKHTKDLFVWLYLRSRYPEAHKGSICMVIPTQQVPRSTQRIYLYGYTYAALTQKHTKGSIFGLYISSHS